MVATVGKRRTILVVEDDVDLRRLWRVALSFEGFTVEEVGDGIDALQHIELGPPDLVLLDLDLPKLGGLSVQAEIAAHAFTRSIPVVIVTGSSMDLGHLDVRCVLRKPVAPEQIVTTVQSCLQSGAQGASH